MFDYRKLRGKILEKCGSDKAFAKAIGLSPQSISSKFNNKTYFTQEQIMNALTVLDLNKKDIPEYFFN
ncbi:MAG TPA: DUF739 family protein [Acholeplasma sp.]|jgi:hypothetical protein|nr:DUF739 family protein [Acholeplasma sp.]